MPFTLGDEPAPNDQFQGKLGRHYAMCRVLWASLGLFVLVAACTNAQAEDLSPTQPNSDIRLQPDIVYWQAMKWLEAQGVDINAWDDVGQTPMHYAAAAGNVVDIMEWLKTQGADINARDVEGQTPMHYAAEYNAVDAMEWLKAQGADLNAQDDTGQTPMHYAAEYNAVDALDWLKAQGADINVGDDTGKTPVHYAARRNAVDVMKWLKAQGADIHARDGTDQTPMHDAAFGNAVDAMKWLKAQGANINTRDDDYTGKKPMHYAAWGGAVDAMRWLKTQGSSVNAVSLRTGQTSMHYAAWGGAVNAMRWLKGHGADLNARDFGDLTPMHYAAQRNAVDVMKWLKAKGADINAQDDTVQTPMHYAAEYNAVDVMEWLKTQGADINARDVEGKTPMHYAAEYNAVDVMEWLKAQGADLNARDGSGQTPIHYAAEYNAVDVMEWLKTQGADINARDVEGKTPMHYAAEYNAVDVMEWLKAQGADLNARDGSGQTPMHNAAWEGAVGAVMWLKANSPDATSEEQSAEQFQAFRSHINSLASGEYDDEHDNEVPFPIRIESAVEITVTLIKEALVPEVSSWRQIQTLADGLSRSMDGLYDYNYYSSVPKTVAERLVVKEGNPQYRLVGLSLLDEIESGVSAEVFSEFVGTQFQLPEAKSIQKKIIGQSLQEYDKALMTFSLKGINYSVEGVGVSSVVKLCSGVGVEATSDLISQIDRNEKLRQMLLNSGIANLNYAFATMVMEGLTPRGRNESRAFAHFAAGVDEKHAPSMFRVGLMMEHGLGTEADLETALQIHRRAVELDKSTSAPSALLLAERFEVGDSVERDWAMATHYYTKAFTNMGSAEVAHVIYDRLVDQTGFWSEGEGGGDLLTNIINDSSRALPITADIDHYTRAENKRDHAKGIASELGRLYADTSSGQTFNWEEAVHWLRIGDRDDSLLRDILRLRPELAENAKKRASVEQINVPEWAAQSDPSAAMTHLANECHALNLVDFVLDYAWNRAKQCADSLKRASLGFYNQNLVETAFAHLTAISDIELEEIEIVGRMAPLAESYDPDYEAKMRWWYDEVPEYDHRLYGDEARVTPEYTNQLVDVLAFYGDYEEAERRARIARGGTITASLRPLRRQVVRSLESGEATEGLHALLNTLARQGNSSARDLLAALRGQINRNKPVLDIAVARERFESVAHMANSVSFAKNARQLAPIEADAGNLERALELEMMALKSDLTRSAAARLETGPIGRTLSDVCNLSKTSQRLFDYDAPEIAIVLAKRAVNRLQETRQLLSGLPERLRLCFLTQVEGHYRWLAGLLVAQDRPRESSRVIQMLKNFESFEFASRTRDLAGDAFDTLPFSDTEQRLWDALSNLTPPNGTLLSRLTTLRNLGAVRSLTTAEQLEMTSLEAQLDAETRERKSELHAVSDAVGQAKPPDFAIGKLVDRYLQSPKNKSTAILQYVVGKDRLSLVLTTYRGQSTWSWDRIGNKAFSEDEINNKVKYLRGAVSDPGFDPLDFGKQLHDLLLPDEVKTVLSRHSIDTLVFSLDRHLRYVPVAALYDGTQWLSEQYILSQLSAGTVADGSESTQNSDIIAGFGTTGSFHRLPALPAVQDELKSIVQESADDPGYLRGTARLDQDFTRSSLVSALSFGNSAAPLGGVLHLASHFIVGKTEADSVLLLGDGNFLSVREIREGLGQGADLQDVSLLTLSACNTGFGTTDADGSELESLAVVAQHKGAGAVLASVLEVPDGATSLLMSEFYRNYAAGLSPARALREAQVALISGDVDASTSPDAVLLDRRHPYYWASFVLLEGSL